MDNNQREISPKICKQELWFFSMAHRALCAPNFIEIPLTVFELSSGHEIVWK